MQHGLLKDLNKVEQIANYSKARRLLNNPFKYFFAIAFKKLIYPFFKKERVVFTRTFFGGNMQIALPASTDIYLTGGKSHASEIRLAKFLIRNLKPMDTFIDIGAHYGYFSLLANEVMEQKGKIFSFEPSPNTYKLLKHNAALVKNIKAIQQAVSNKEEQIIFYEFPNLYAEYNTIDANQFQQEVWFAAYAPKKQEVQAITIDQLVIQEKIMPNIIKIDVEGAEYKVIEGAAQFLQSNSPKIAMEYVASHRGNKEHTKAHHLLLEMGYRAYLIDKDGYLQSVANINAYLEDEELESDNIVYSKSLK
jgi:FkbM family methyltransferase